MLDTFVMYDEVELKLLPPEIQPISEDLTENEIKEFKVNLFQHQIDGINFGLNNSKWLLTFGMGCGKSATSMLLAETLHNRGQAEHCLVVCAVASLRQNWKKEIEKFSNLSCTVLGEKISKNGRVSYATVKERVEQLKKPIDEFFVVINIETLRDDSVIQAISRGPNKLDIIIVDEIHRCNNKNTQSGGNLLKLKSKYKIGMSGTLLVNKPLDLYLPLSFIEKEHATLTNFKNQYCDFGSTAFTDYQIVGYKNLDLLKDELDFNSLRRTLDEVVDMPLKTVETELLEMSDDQSKFYESVKEGVKSDAMKVELNSANLLSLMTRLRQATVFPGILTTEKISAIKVERCNELINDLILQHEKVVVFSNFKQPLDLIAAEFKDYNPLICSGDYSEDQVSKNVDKFQNDPDTLICLCTHARMGTGFNLNSAAYAIMLDTPYTYSSLDQSICRLYRLNNTRPCYIKLLVTKNTVDERVAEIVETKKDLGNYMMDGQMSENLQAELRRTILDL